MARLPSFRVALTGLALLALLTPFAPTAGADENDTEPETHCVAEVIGQLKSGEYELSEPECYSEFSEAMDAAGLGESADTPARAAALASTLAVHFDGANYTGSSFSVAGVDCLGGYINLSAAWDNRVSSTFGGLCGRIRHWSGANLTGVFQDTLPHGNLSTLNNLSTSIQYLN